MRKRKEEARMSAKKILGIVLVVIAVGLLVFTILSVGANMAKTGPMVGKINSYKPPFRNHGLLMAATGIASVIIFLGGIVLISAGRKR